MLALLTLMLSGVPDYNLPTNQPAGSQAFRISEFCRLSGFQPSGFQAFRIPGF
jgi:hypothetical protein